MLEGNFLKAHKGILLGVLYILFSAGVAKAAPPLAPYEPNETLAPTCLPGTTNCTVRPSARPGINTDITSLSGLSTPLSIGQGGTGGTTTAQAFFNLAPSQTGNAGKFLSTNGFTAAWSTFLTPTPTWGSITGTLSNQTDLSNALQTKEDVIATGTTNHYWRGDKTWATLTKTAVGLGNVENTALSTWLGTSALSTVGTIVSGTWNGSVLGVAYGGTNLTALGAGSQLLGVNVAGTGLEYKTLVAGSNISITSSSGALTIAASAGNGEANTASNVGTGFSIFKQKIGVDLQFKTLSTSSLKIALTSTTNSVGIDVNENALTLGNLGGVLPIAKGGTGAEDAATALTNLGAAARGANSDITSLSGLLTPLSVGQGGTGMSSFTAGSLLFMDGATGNIGENNAGLFWDNDKQYFGIKTNIPVNTFEVQGSVGFKVQRINKDAELDDQENIILVDASSQDIVVRLPAARDVPGRTYTVKTIAVNDSRNDVTIISDSKIDGEPELDLSTRYQSRTFIADPDANEWYVIQGL